ncbi:hypothetical protein D5086_032688 [Populus alba]|uniref:Uncharacterized protein n=2 Tax=Populus alba TaxID=43335 RepID=A0A4U5PR74_POPAL|nr:hypothetical protein D5086_0000193720 [Populus alba]
MGSHSSAPIKRGRPVKQKQTHNPSNQHPPPRNSKLKSQSCQRDALPPHDNCSALGGFKYEDTNHYESKASHPKMAHPWPDHFNPLHVAMGAAGDDAKAKLVHRS